MASLIYNSDKWISVPMIDSNGLANGLLGGEGCRQVLCPVLDPVEGRYGLFGTDIGGLYRSTDGGNTWQIATLGLDSAGACSAAFDPNNTARCLVVGANSAAQSVNGLFLSIDHGETWQPVQRALTCNRRDLRNQIAYDPTSYDKAVGGSAVIYWSRENDDRPRNSDNHPGLYKSTDGGLTWQRLKNSTLYGGSDIAVHPQKGWLYAASQGGVFRSVDGGVSFERILSVSALSMCVVSTAPDNIYVSTKEGIYISDDSGDNFYMIRGVNYPSFCPTRLRVSPADPNRMILQNDVSADLTNPYAHTVWYSHNGGKSWQLSTRHIDRYNVAWCPSNAAISSFSWHPIDPDRVICNWGYICASTNGGADFYYSSTGFCGINTSGMVRFNVNDSQLVSMSSYNYNGSFSTDGGNTWEYINWSGYGWGGTMFGSYCMSDKVVFASLRDTRQRVNLLVVTHDGGKTVEQTDITVSGYSVGMGAPGRPEIGFMGEWRTDDYAKSWTRMTGCTGVFCADSVSGRLFGCNGSESIVMSSDGGVSWTEVCPIEGGNFFDMAYSRDSARLYVADGEHLLYVDIVDDRPKLKKLDSFLYDRLVKRVTVDPKNNDVIYVACKSDSEYQNRNIWRSTDAGQTWVCLTREVADGRDGLDGARRPATMDINTVTGELFVFTSGKGVWKIAPPPCR